MISPERKAKIRWNCRRGMLELDLLLSKFMANRFDQLSDQEIEKFEKLLNCQDPDLYAWLMGHEEVTNKELEAIVATIRLNNTH